MTLGAGLLPEFDHEMAGTRRALERVPDAALDWRPHPKSTTLRGLATHIANLPTWASITIAEKCFDAAPPGGAPPRATPVDSARMALDRFDVNVAAARAAIAGASDETLLVPWSFLAGGKVMFTLPRIGVLRNLVMNHMIHHRGQLSVYLRLNDVPVPSLYGPTADEPR